MGQLVSILGLLYIRDCDVMKVVNDVSLFPPYPQYYKIEKTETNITGTYGIEQIDNRIPQCISIRYVAITNDISICLMHYKSRSSKQVLIHSHGNAVDIGCCIRTMLVIGHELDMDIIIYDYEGYGWSEGVAKCDSLTRDLSAVYDYARQFFQGKDIFLIGESSSELIMFLPVVGSVPTCALAASLSQHAQQTNQVRPLGGIILHAALFSGASAYPGGCLLRNQDPYDNASQIRNITCPIFHIHGREDEVIPFAKGSRLHAISPTQYPPWWIEGGKHNNLIAMDEELYKKKIAEFIQFCNSVNN